MVQQAVRRFATVAGGPGSRLHFSAAVACVAAALTATLILLPVAARPGPAMPGVIAVSETALVVLCGLGASMLSAQYLRSRQVSHLLAASGALFTAFVLYLQMLCMLDATGAGSGLGSGLATTTWLWTGWHLGPPTIVLATVMLLTWWPDAAVPRPWRFAALAGAVVLALTLACSWVLLAKVLRPWMPAPISPDDYRAVSRSGVGPALEILSLLALAAMVRSTRGRRSALDMWIIAALALLTLDMVLSQAGGTRGSLGAMAGRALAATSAGALICAYLYEVERLRARAEAALGDLAATHAGLGAARRLEAVGQLTGGVAHDFNNLLMVVTSAFDMIGRRPDDRQRVIDMAATGLRAAERGARLTRQLLTFARRQALRPEVTALGAWLGDFRPLAVYSAGESMQVEFDLADGVYPVLVDTAELQAAMLNLVANARDARKADCGRIAISSRNARAMSSTVAARTAGDYVVVTVADDGHGMTAEIADHAFEPFFTTKDFGKGSGLGLSQVYGFALAAGGEAVIHTAPGEGTRVEIWLPRASCSEKAADDGTKARPMPRPALPGETVLAVEDEPDVLTAVIENLADLGYKVLSARDADEALEQLRGPEHVDLLFSDIVMPGAMNGVQLAAEAIRLRPTLRVLLTSGFANSALDSLPAHMDVLPKPYRRAELAERLHLVMRAT